MIESIKLTFAIATMCILFVLFALFLAGAIDYFYTKNYCEEWGQNTERRTKFISTYPLWADCLVLTGDGWISVTNLEVIETPTVSQ